MKAIFYFVDGFAWDYLESDGGQFGGIDWSIVRPLETVLGYSSSIVPVLLSGKLPAQTGLWTEYYREDQRPSVLARVASQSSALSTPLNMARLIAFRFARLAGWQGAHRLRIPLELSHHFKRHAIDYMQMPPCALNSPTIVDVCRDLDLSMTFAFVGKDADALKVVADARRDHDRSDVLFVYDSTVDHAGHSYGPDIIQIAPYIARIGDTIRTLRSLYGEVETLVFSDHGMTAVKDSFDIFKALAPLRIGRDFLAFPDSTFARFWYPSDEARLKVRAKLVDAPGEFLTKRDAARYGVPYPDTRYGDDVLVASEGVVFHPSYISPGFFRTEFPDKGMHGYRPECRSADGVVLCSGASFGTEVGERVPAASVFELMSAILRSVAS